MHVSRLAWATPKRADRLTDDIWTPTPDPIARQPAVMVWLVDEATCSIPDHGVGVEGFADPDGTPADNHGPPDRVATPERVRDNSDASSGDRPA
ncbi:hypothetical protein ACIPX0_46155 [Streptomyces sp. NPDC090075]|uniref:hypothetical protein n=1 Tax=Streptomyces sp. NPDC090075 TaxID=3365937 RepID=UPI00381FE177